MKIVLLTVPSDSMSQSMPRFATFIGEGMKARGHQVEYLSSGRLNSAFGGWFPQRLRKWTSYFDQYLLFPHFLRERVAKAFRERGGRTLFVLTDQGLGMWLPSIAQQPHVVHCHDLLAIRSARGEFPENPTGVSGRIYQRMILSGLRRGRNFLSVSEATRESLSRILGEGVEISEVIPNPLNRAIPRIPYHEACRILGLTDLPVDERPILHVGGNQWYKNRIGLLEIYHAYAETCSNPRPLWMVGPEPTSAMRLIAGSPACRQRVSFKKGVGDDELAAMYAVAWTLLFPSLEEGFGWPVLEAMAAGCLVVATGIPPMTEVMGQIPFQLPRKLMDGGELEWRRECAEILRSAADLTEEKRESLVAEGSCFNF